MTTSNDSLVAQLGPSLTAALSGSRTLDATDPDDPRIAFAWKVFQIIEAVDGADVAGAWFLGANPMLGDDSVSSAIREQRFKEVEAAAMNYCENSGGSGW